MIYLRKLAAICLAVCLILCLAVIPGAASEAEDPAGSEPEFVLICVYPFQSKDGPATYAAMAYRGEGFRGGFAFDPVAQGQLDYDKFGEDWKYYMVEVPGTYAPDSITIGLENSDTDEVIVSPCPDSPSDPEDLQNAGVCLLDEGPACVSTKWGLFQKYSDGEVSLNFNLCFFPVGTAEDGSLLYGDPMPEGKLRLFAADGRSLDEALQNGSREIMFEQDYLNDGAHVTQTFWLSVKEEGLDEDTLCEEMEGVFGYAEYLFDDGSALRWDYLGDDAFSVS